MRPTLSAAAGLALPATLLAAAGLAFQTTSVPPEDPPPPATDVWLVELEAGNGGWRAAVVRNVTDREGYDNQPYFLPGGEAFLYTSIREGQADVYRYDLGEGRSERVTSTPESEYSPTPMPDGDGFSTVRVEEGGRQRLWHFPSQGPPRPLLEGIEPVGYHAWVDDGVVALFILGDPPTLQIADLHTGRSRTVAGHIGRSLHPAPRAGSVSFVRKVSEEVWRLEVLDLETGEAEALGMTPPASEDFTWTPDGRILLASGTRLMVLEPGSGEEWREVLDLEPWGLGEITRLDISDDEGRLVVVASRGPGRSR